MADRTIRVDVRNAPYDIVIGAGIIDRLHEVVPLPATAHKGVLLTSRTIYELYGERVSRSLEATGLSIELLILQDGESAKSLRTLEQCWTFFAGMTLGRRDVVFALGGGVIGDLAGFAAATWARGVPFVQIATTMVAQVDSAIGGKTGVNLPAGKNMVGAFHQPLVVVNDISTLTTLPERELRAGMGEVVKCGFIADPVILELVRGKTADEIHRNVPLLSDLVSRSAAVKARVVSDDELETGGREILNYGHTLGHGLETLARYEGYLHGEAVAVGMVFAAMLGERIGVSRAGLTDETRAVLTGLGLPTAAREPFEVDRIWPVMQLDKKALDGVRFVLVPEPGRAVVVRPSDQQEVRDLIAEFSRA